MLPLRIGMISTMGTEGVELLHRSLAIFTRDEKASAKYGRAKVYSVASDGGSVHVSTCGVLIAYGSVDETVAHAMMVKPCRRVLVIVPAKPKKDGQILANVGRLKARGIEVGIFVVKKSKMCSARDLSAGGACVEVDLSAPPAHPTSAPSVPVRKVETPAHSAPNVNALKKKS